MYVYIYMYIYIYTYVYIYIYIYIYIIKLTNIDQDTLKNTTHVNNKSILFLT